MQEGNVLIYVASSWRNELQPVVVDLLEGCNGCRVYDFRNPDGRTGFKWYDIDPEWQSWSPAQFHQIIRQNPIAQAAFDADMDAIVACDICILVLPCGRSAHLELGWAIRNGARGIVLLDAGEPELMYKMVHHLCVNMRELICAVETERDRARRMADQAARLADA